MREIKFRAFNQATQSWYYMIISNQDGPRFECSNPQLLNTLTPLKQLENWQQYAGLPDKSGKEIYEGDIAECDSGSLWKVYWAEGIGGFRLALLSDEDYCDFVDLDLYKIIGNIWENPELLESK